MVGCFAFLTFRLNPNICLLVFINHVAFGAQHGDKLFGTESQWGQVGQKFLSVVWNHCLASHGLVLHSELQENFVKTHKIYHYILLATLTYSSSAYLLTILFFLLDQSGDLDGQGEIATHLFKIKQMQHKQI